MDDVACWPARDRADLFEATALRRSLAVAIVEKDFWVCWALKRLFTLPDPPAGLLFKGGTSLSKVFNAIERFSEDVDLSFDRAGLGFGGASDPLNAASGKKKTRAVEALAEKCKQVIREQFLPQLLTSFAGALRKPSGDTWMLALAEDDPDQQTLLFSYPAEGPARPTEAPAYIRPVIRLEIGARSDHWPTVDAVVTPFAAEELPHVFKDRNANVRVLAVERTFWEKATLLHAWHHAPADKVFRDRQSRHYYDVVRLYVLGRAKEALKDVELLGKVARHKEVFFPAAWARYAEARPGTLRLVPPVSRIAELQRDYEKMREMIYGELPSFDSILDVLRQIEKLVNERAE
jgi:predicted nucleotidyltransferase component of viral defense system